MAQSPNHPILTRVNEILNKKNIEEIKKMVLFIGKDRENSYKFVERYISPNLFETIVLDRDDSSISATKMREYALENTDESFDEFLKGAFDISEEEFEEFKKDPKNEEIIEIMKEVFNQVGKILLEQKQKRLKGKLNPQHSGGKKHINSKRKSKKRKTKQRKTKQRKTKQRKTKQRKTKQRKSKKSSRKLYEKEPK
jgi:hypothetical protein